MLMGIGRGWEYAGASGCLGLPKFPVHKVPANTFRIPVCIPRATSQKCLGSRKYPIKVAP